MNIGNQPSSAKNFNHKVSVNSANFSPQSAFTFSKLTIETLEKGVKYVQS